MSTMANSEVPDGGISSGPALFAKTKSVFREINILFEIITCNLSIYTMDHPDLILSNFMENKRHIV